MGAAPIGMMIVGGYPPSGYPTVTGWLTGRLRIAPALFGDIEIEPRR